MKRGVVLTAAILAAILASSCTKPLPPVPTIAIDGLDPEVRDLIGPALKQAEAQPPSGQAAGRLGMTLQAHALYPEAVQAYQRAMRLDPKEFAWPYYSALSLQMGSRPEEALDAITAALRIRPDYTPAILKRAELLFKLARLPESTATIEPLLAKDPHAAAPLYALARVKAAQEDFTAAEDLYKRACQAYPTFGAAYYGLAVVGKKLGHDAESVQNFDLAQRYTGDSPPSDDPLLIKILELETGVGNRTYQAHDLLKQGQLDEAEKLFKQILNGHPNELDALLNLLYLAHYPNHGTIEEIQSLYERAKRIDPKIAEIYAFYGNAMATQGKFDVAIAAMNKAIEIKPDYADAHLYLGIIAERQNHGPEAVKHYRAAVASKPGYRPAQLALGRLLVTLGQNREAIPALLPALDVDDTDTTIAMAYVAQAYANSGDLEKAKDYMKQARARAAKTGPPELLQQLDAALQQLGSRP